MRCASSAAVPSPFPAMKSFADVAATSVSGVTDEPTDRDRGGERGDGADASARLRAATRAAVPPMLAPITATRGMPVDRRYRTAACTSRQSIARSVSPLEHPASPPGQ